MFTTLRHLLLGGTATMLSAGAALAQTTPPGPAGTAAGTPIVNQAKATYSVNGTPATVDSNETRFVVDRKVDFTVVAQTAATQVNLGQREAVLTFTVTNHTNSKQDFLLDPDQQNLPVGILLGIPGSDDFDVSNMRAFADDGNGVFDAADTRTWLDEMAPDETRTVFIVADIPATGTPNLAHVSLHVIAAEGDGAGTQGTALIQTSLGAANRDDQIDIVFADDDSDGLTMLGDSARNGQARVYAAYQLGTRTVDLSVLKSSRIISDGVDTLNMRALPGAVVEYCLLVSNANLLTPASNVVLTDKLPPHTSYVSNSIKVGGTCLLGGEQQDDDANDTGDGTQFGGSYDGATRTVTATLPSVIGPVPVAAVFRVTID